MNIEVITNEEFQRRWNIWRSRWDRWARRGRKGAEWLEMGERQKAYDARMRLPGQVDVGGGWMAPCRVAT